MMKQFLLTTVFFLTIFTLQATDGYKIKVKIKGFEKDTIYLGYHYGEKQYLRDTTAKNAQGWFVFEGEKLLEPGMYLIVMPPDNKFFEILVNTDNQEFEVETSYDKPADEMKVKNSQDNQIFYDYLHFIASKRPEAEDLKKKIDEAGEDAAKKEPLEKKLESINDEVKNYQQNLLKKYPASLTGAIIKGTFGLEYPEFKGTEEEINLQKWRYTVDHYFDNIDLRDDRLVRTSFLFQRIDYFVNKLTVQHPDSINRGLDYILEKMDPKGENFKFYLVHFLNTFAKSNIAGMDAVYVHLVKKYYEKGLATWTDEETMKKILDNANTLEPLLIGKIAPNIQMQKQDGTKLSLHDIQSPYTVMFFWDPECGHCKKAAPFMVEFDKKFKSKGVTIFSICTEFTEDVPKCWESIKEKEFTDFINVVDPYHRSKYKTIYDIKSTPQIYILDSKKEILMKKIGAEQLGEVMDQIIKMGEEKKDPNKSSGK